VIIKRKLYSLTTN